MGKYDITSAVTGGISSTGTIVGGVMSGMASINHLSGIDLFEASSQNPSKGTTIGIGIGAVVATSAGGATTVEPDTIVYFKSQPYDVVERKAQELYNKLNKNYEPNDSQIIVAEDAESAQILEDILNGRTKEEILIALKSFEEAITTLNGQSEIKEKQVIKKERIR